MRILRARALIDLFIKAKVDVVKIGFLRNVDRYNQDITACKDIDELYSLFPDDKGQTIVRYFLILLTIFVV